jgi:exonuclease SbcC
VKLKKIVIKGFLRFKDRVEVEFPQSQVTLIAGENGAGKTSILDAMCLCFYGRTFRTSGTTKSGFLNTRDLINHESEKAVIEVEFENYGHNYVVNRTLFRSKSAQGELFEDGIGKAVGQGVYDYIKSFAIGLDWEGFVKSTVILQGEMSALTKADPAKRKEAFRKLFGLERYVIIYDQLAKRKIDGKSVTKGNIEEVNKILIEEVSKIPSLKNDLKRFGQAIRELKEQKSTLVGKIRERKKEKVSFERDYQKYKVIKERTTNVEGTISRTKSDITKSRRELSRLQRIKDGLPSLEKSYQEFTQVQQKVDKSSPLKRKFDNLHKKLSGLEGVQEEKEKNITSLKKDIEKTIHEIKQLEEQIPDRVQVKNAKRELKRLEKGKERLNNEKSGIEANLKSVGKSIKDLLKKLSEVKGKKKCPVCLQDIKDPSQIERHYKSENQKLLSQQNKIQERLNQLTTVLASTSKEFEKANGNFFNLQERFGKKNIVNRESKTLKSLEKKKKLTEGTIQIINLRMEKQKGLISKLNFDEKSYSADESTLLGFRKQKIAESYSNAKVQVKRLPEENKKLATLQKAFAGYEQRLKGLQNELDSFGDIERGYKKAQTDFDNAQNNLNQNQVQLVTEKTNKENTRKTLKEAFVKKQKLGENEDKIRELGKELIILEELRNVFKNIPENILRRLRPYIEKEGNDIVSELSDSEITALNIEEETLNVAATMTGEVRPIQYFSEGQKTRINMALRVAISRILSKLPQTEEHAYAIMQTLFIDEGDFGNLDESGIRDTVSVIRDLTKEFDRVIVISHVPAIREILQGRVLEVVKTGLEESIVKASGSVPGQNEESISERSIED